MQQLYTTGLLPGTTRPSGSALPAFKAASHGLRPEDVQDALPHTGYAPPPAGSDGPLPVRLALLNTPHAGRVLTHVAPNGGTYFAHALLHVPPTADAQMAIQTWGSPLWQRHEPDFAGDLPELPYLPVADVLDDDAIKGWLNSTPAHRDMLEFVLTALLGSPGHTRIFVAAPAEDVAKVVYAVTRALPVGMLDNFTFSTYEPDPLASQARLVGHDTGSADWDLPTVCYDGAGVAFNPATGRNSPLPAEVPFAAFAVAALADGVMAALDDFRATWQRLGLADARQFDLVYRLTRGGLLTKDEAATAAQHPTLAAVISSRVELVKQFVEWALDDKPFAHAALSRVIIPLRQKADAVAKLADAVKQHGFKLIAGGDRTRAANALEVILPMAAPGKANAVWGAVLAQVPDPAALTGEMRWYLLPRLVRFKHHNAAVTAVDPALAKWLDVPAERLGELLALDLPKAYQLAAARACLLRDDEPTVTFARAVAGQPALVLQLLQPGEAIPEDATAKLFELLITEVPGHGWFEDVLANAHSFPDARRNRFFETVLAAGKIDADRVIRAQGTTLLELFTGQSGLDRLARQFLAAPPADIHTSPVVLNFLGKLMVEPQVGDDVKARVAAVLVVRDFLDRPDFTPDAMAPVAAALQLEPAVLPACAKEEVIAVVNSELTRRCDSPDLQADLEAVLLDLGSALAADPAALYRELLRRQRQRKDFTKHTNTLHAFLAVALGAARNEEAAKQTDGLEAEAFAIAAEAGQLGGAKVIDAIGERTKEWPKAARTQWGFLYEAVRPKGPGLVVRDLLFFGTGILAASLVWYVVAQLTR